MAALVCVIMTCNIRVREGLEISTVFHSDSFVDDDLDDTDGDDLDDNNKDIIMKSNQFLTLA